MLRICFGHTLTTQQITAMRIAYRQRIDPLSPARPEPSLEVCTPHLVGFFNLLKRLAVHRNSSPLALGAAQPRAPQDLSKRAHRGPLDCLLLPPQMAPQLFGSPMRMPILQLQNLLLNAAI